VISVASTGVKNIDIFWKVCRFQTAGAINVMLPWLRSVMQDDIYSQVLHFLPDSRKMPAFPRRTVSRRVINF